MAQIKTGVSLDETLFHEAEHLARQLRITRSGLYARALQEFIERRKSEQLLDQLNAAYDGPADPDDAALLRGVRRSMQRLGDSWE